MFTSHPQRCLALRPASINLCASVEQRLDDMTVPISRCQVKRREVALVSESDLGSLGNQELYDVVVTAMAGDGKGCPPSLSMGVIDISPPTDKRCHFSIITSLGGDNGSRRWAAPVGLKIDVGGCKLAGKPNAQLGFWRQCGILFA
jgi:hypothetical protein